MVTGDVWVGWFMDGFWIICAWSKWMICGWFVDDRRRHCLKSDWSIFYLDVALDDCSFHADHFWDLLDMALLGWRLKNHFFLMVNLAFTGSRLAENVANVHHDLLDHFPFLDGFSYIFLLINGTIKGDILSGSSPGLKKNGRYLQRIRSCCSSCMAIFPQIAGKL